jgi:catechol 2,3-dioxygenase-like lactoylglutathione lyase family enzyme
MAIETSGIHHVGIRVTDLERARRFYTSALGFRQVTDGPDYVIIDAGGTLVGLLGDSSQTPPADRFDPHRVGLDHLALGVRDEATLRDLERRLSAEGVPNNGIEVDPVLGRPYVSFYDPDGIAWEAYALPPS